MRHLLLVCLTLVLFAAEEGEKVFDCTRIFEERKAELLVELERLDEQRQALEALKTATDELLGQKKVVLDAKEQELNATMSAVTEKEQNVARMLEENRKLLEEMKALKMDKVASSYAKMKASAAADILSGMPTDEAARLIGMLKPKIVGKILAKMDAAKAAEITQQLSATPPE